MGALLLFHIKTVPLEIKTKEENPLKIVFEVKDKKYELNIR
ncbi:hypothetical protein [Campylobacter ureolyticus]|uniref:Uncharacterized protein n=1 Tax=Campylobacter ureolyticus TaxID=827 RepID=A0A9Q4PUA3_9BACT|nr:hypothetical protein [Campylobacter ureolyticus]MCZ6102902.1 hypothetical protein [Campylobacter ureolyticus]MCZ6159116.1 hypothetical protein [Campylobacter ureolyticus]